MKKILVPVDGSVASKKAADVLFRRNSRNRPGKTKGLAAAFRLRRGGQGGGYGAAVPGFRHHLGACGADLSKIS